MPKRQLSFTYILFYLILSEDTWRIAAGFIFAAIIGPKIAGASDVSVAGEVMLWLMLLAIGWGIAGWPARKITGMLKKAVKKAGKKL